MGRAYMDNGVLVRIEGGRYIVTHIERMEREVDALEHTVGRLEADILDAYRQDDPHEGFGAIAWLAGCIGVAGCAFAAWVLWGWWR